MKRLLEFFKNFLFVAVILTILVAIFLIPSRLPPLWQQLQQQILPPPPPPPTAEEIEEAVLPLIEIPEELKGKGILEKALKIPNLPKERSGTLVLEDLLPFSIEVSYTHFYGKAVLVDQKVKKIVEDKIRASWALIMSGALDDKLLMYDGKEYGYFLPSVRKKIQEGELLTPNERSSLKAYLLSKAQEALDQDDVLIWIGNLMEKTPD